MLENHRSIAGAFARKLCHLFLVESLFLLYLDCSIFVFLIHLGVHKLLTTVAVDGKSNVTRADDLLGPLRLRVAATGLLSFMPVCLHLLSFSFGGHAVDPFSRYRDTLRHAKFVFFAPQLDHAASAMSVFLLDALLAGITFLVLSAGVVVSGETAVEPYTFALQESRSRR